MPHSVTSKHETGPVPVETGPVSAGNGVRIRVSSPARELRLDTYALLAQANQELLPARVPGKYRALVQGAYAAGSLIVKQRVWMKLFSSSNRPLEAMRTLSVEPSLHRSLAL